MGFILWSSTIVICLVSQVSCLPREKPIGEWASDRDFMYPNPYINFTKCNRPEPSGLCDVNLILTEEQRIDFGSQPELQAGQQSEDQKKCTPNSFKVTMAIMKKIGPDISDYREDAKTFARKLRNSWNLSDCTVILIASKNDNTSFAEAGSAVKQLLPANKTEEMDKGIYETYFEKGRFVEGLNETIMQYRTAVLEATQMTTTMLTTPSSGTNAIVGVIVCILAVSIIAIIIALIVKQRKKKAHTIPSKEEEHLTSPKAV